MGRKRIEVAAVCGGTSGPGSTECAPYRFRPADRGYANQGAPGRRIAAAPGPAASRPAGLVHVAGPQRLWQGTGKEAAPELGFRRGRPGGPTRARHATHTRAEARAYTDRRSQPVPTLDTRAVLRALRRAPERLAHAGRRRRALALLAQRDFPPAFLFVCHGNICRSPYAAMAFARLLPPELAGRTRIASAGFLSPDRETPDEGRAAAGRRGIDLSGHRSAQLTGPDVPRTGLALVMNELQRAAVCRLLGWPADDVIILGDLDPGTPDTREIGDPWGGGAEAFDESYARIDRCVAALAAAFVGAPASAGGRTGAARRESAASAAPSASPQSAAT